MCVCLLLFFCLGLESDGFSVFFVVVFCVGVFFVKSGDGSGDERDAFLSETSRRILNDAMRPGVANKWELCFLMGAAISLSLSCGAQCFVLRFWGLLVCMQHGLSGSSQFFVVGLSGGFDGGKKQRCSPHQTRCEIVPVCE